MPLDFDDPKLQKALRDAYEQTFPKLTKSHVYKVTSKPTTIYNCIGWAATKKTKSWWWPDRYWPTGPGKLVVVDEFLAAFAARGYKTLSDDSFDPRLEKIALYCLDNVPQHAAWQLRGAIWTSKMGSSQDIEHALADLEGGPYGKVTHYLARKRRP